MLSFVVFLIANIALQLLAPKPDIPKPKRYGLNEFSLPTATEDRSLPMIFGTVPVAGNLIWVGDYYANEVSEEVSTGWFSSAERTLGYKYHIGMWLTLANCPCDSVQGVLWGDRTAWKGTLTLSRTTTTDLMLNYSYAASEGQEIEDGIAGVLRFYNQSRNDYQTGNPAPLPNPYVAGQLGVSEVPSYPDICHVVLLGPSSGYLDGGPGGGLLNKFYERTHKRSGFVGSSPHIPALQVILKRLPDVKTILHTFHGNLFNSASRGYAYPLTGPFDGSGTLESYINSFIDSVADIGGDANPAFVIAELLCARSQYVGPRLSPFALDWGSFMRAAEKLKSEGMGVSFAWEKSRSVGDVISDVCKQINATLHIHERLGVLSLRLIRESDESVYTFDSSNIVNFASATRTTTNEAPNEIQVPYSDRAMQFDTRRAVAKNTALVQQVGTVISREEEFIGVSNSRVASLLATRTLRSLAASLMQVRFTATVPAGTILKPGDVVTVAHERLGQALRMRITTARWNDYNNRQQVEFEAIEDVFRDGSIEYEDTPEVPAEPAPSVTEPVTSPVLVAAPYALSLDEYERPLYYAEATSPAARQYRLSVAQGVSVWAYERATYASEYAAPAVSGTLDAVLSSYLTGTSAKLNLTNGARDALLALGLRGEVLAIVDGEWLAASGFSLSGNLLTISTLKRGLFDTVPQRHEAGTKVTLLLGYAVGQVRMQTRLSTSGPTLPGVTSVAVRADTRGPGGTVWAFDEAAGDTEATLAAQTYNPSRCVLPLPPAYVTISSRFGCTSPLDNTLEISRSTSALLAWRNRNRLSALRESAFSAMNDPEPSAYVEYVVDWETTGGSGVFTSNSFVSAAAGASQATINTSTIPTGARLVRVSVRSARPSGSGTVRSATYQYFWRLTS
ncbi:phage tail protein [Caldimonas thermodepolymerans]|uniref:Tip attachment protein J domain-containing protein n=1 Tax=Caldimonas thermodepolymerans TaxID=215580 RepID=A0A2S5T3F2_9BURK|nr:phage tail protein [Caldimonas thermodepolymerans]PPE69510.1 hypothetical protein C1702_11245 [Caldimonas thermodepolymerans]QPC30976.1 phage tail protein [Caldimonas thermodepolymerans]RDH97010.1 putative tail protein [Caldimonas thermodepolymerans]